MKRFEVKDENGETVSNRDSIQFARLDSEKCGGTIYELMPVVNGMGKRTHTWKFPVE